MFDYEILDHYTITRFWRGTTKYIPSKETAVKLVREKRFGFISTTFIHTQLISMNAKYRQKTAAARETAAT